MPKTGQKNNMSPMLAMENNVQKTLATRLDAEQRQIPNAVTAPTQDKTINRLVSRKNDTV